MSTDKYWAAAEEAFRKGNRSWFPCPAEFYTDMLEVVPPTIMDFQPACRMATLQEFIAELEAAPEAPALAGS